MRACVRACVRESARARASRKDEEIRKRGKRRIKYKKIEGKGKKREGVCLCAMIALDEVRLQV